MSKRFRVYIAGSYEAQSVLAVLDNMRRGMKMGTKLMLLGFAPFVPWFDFHFQLLLEACEHLTVNDYYDYSIAWLEASEAVLVLPDSEKSKGTQKEIERAVELNIPVFLKVGDLIDYRKSLGSFGSELMKNRY